MIRVVLLEDEPNSSQDIAGQLQRVSYDVVAFPAVVDEVLAHIDELRPDVILMDVRLKGEMDKVEAALQIKRLHDVPVILVTADTDEATVRQAIAAEPDGILIKPLEEVELVAAIDVVIQKHRKERQIRQSERRIRELTDSLPQMVYETDAQGAFTFVNAACLSLFGYKKEEFEAGLTIFDAIVPDERSEVHEVFKRWMNGETMGQLERTGLRKDGSTFLLAVRAAAVDWNGALTGMRGVILDVTELKSAEKELIHERDQAQLYLDTVDVIMVALNREGRITLLNRAGCALLGVTLEQAVGSDWFETFLPEDVRTETRGGFEALMAGDRETIRYVEGTLMTSVGEKRVIAWHNAPVQDDEGNVTGTFSTGVDVTERARADQKLRESERHIRELTDALPVFVYETDATGWVTFANGAAFEMFGYTKEDLEAGMSVFQLVTNADKERARTAALRRASGEDVGRMEYAGLRKDGSTVPISVRGAAIMRDGAVVGVRGVAIDISERKLARERERERTHTIETLNRIMAEGNRAASVASFAKNVTNLTLELLRFDAGTIHLTDDGARCAKMRYATGIPDSAAEAIREIPFDKTPYAAVLSEGGPLFVDGQEASRVPHVTELGLKSLAVVPLHRHDETIGALSVGTFKLHIFSQAEKELLTAIGNEVGTVIAKLHTEESLKRHAQMVDLAKDGIIIRNLNDRITYWNKGAERLYGWSAAEAEGQKIYALLQTAHARPWADIKRELCAGGGWKGEFTCTAKNGRLLIVDSRQTLYTDATGEPAAIFEINTDITGRKQAEELLRASERHIRELTSALPVVVYEADTSGRATFVNATLYDMFGYTKEEFEAGMSIYGLVTDADRERARTVSLRRMDRKNVGRAEYTGLRKDGSTFPVAAIGAPITRDGAVVGVRGVIIDSTDEKLAEERVQEHMHTIEMLNRIMTEGNRAASVESFAETLTTLTLELTHFDAGTIHIFDNDARHSNLIYATGIPDPTVAAIRQVPLDETAYAALLDEGAPIFVDGEAVRRVPHVAELGLKSVAVVELHRLDEIVGTFSVGSLKRHIFSQAEKELLTAIGNEAGVVIAKLQADAVIKETLKEREIILKEIHHRVKNNMQIISSLLSLQAAQATEPETVEMLNASQGRIRSMALIHEQLYSSGSLAKIDFARYVESLIAHLQGTFDVDPDAVTITVDVKDTYLGVDTAVPCALIVNELVTNCLKHAFPGATRGTVSVVTHPTNAWTYELIVADTGVGFPRDLDFRATASLGMQLVNALVGQLDGMITLDRTKGTAFNISFKRSPADAGAKPRG